MIAVVMASVVLAGCATAPTPTASPTPSPSPSPTASPTPSPTATPSPTPSPSPTPVPLDQALLNRRLTVLVVGIDSNPDRASRNLPLNTDSMIVASVNAAHTRIATVALPRDTVDLPLPGGGRWRGKANSIFRARGIGALEAMLETTYGVPIDYHVLIDMADFGRLVQAVGGIDVVVPYALYDPSIGLRIGAGKQHLDGNQANRYVRTRHQDGDYARGRRQQQVLIALARKLVDRSTKLNVLGVLRGLASLKTNLPMAKLVTLLEIARRSRTAKVSSMELGPPRFALFQGIEPNSARGWVMIPNVPEMRGYVRSVMRG